MAGEIGRFTAVLGADTTGVTTGLRGSARTIEGFVKDTQRSFAQIGVGGDFGRAGTKAGKEIVAALKAQLDAGRPLLREFAENVDVGNAAAVRVVKQLVAEHERLAVAAGASATELKEISDISHTLQGRELATAASRARQLEENARAAQQQLRGIALAIRDAGRSTAGLDAISRRIGQFSEGTGFASTRTQSLERLRQIEVSLQRALQSTAPTLTQRIQLERELARTSEAVRTASQGTASALTSTTKSVSGLNAGLTSLRQLFPVLGATVAARELLGFAKNTIDAADAMKDFAERSGASVEALSVLGQVAEKSGASQESLSVGLRNLAKNVEALRRGSKDAASAFASIGLSAKDFQGLSIDQILKRVADAQFRFADGSGKTAAALALFGRSGEELIPTLNALANGGFDKATERARVLGGVMSTDLVNSADEFNDAVSDIKTAVSGLGRGILGDLLPSVTGLINAMIEARRRSLEANDAVPKPFRAANQELLRAIAAGPFFAAAFGSDEAEARRARSFGERMKEAALNLLGVRSAAESAQARIATLSSTFVRQGPPRPDITVPVSRDDEIKQLRDLHNAFALNAGDLVRARALEKELTKEIQSGTLTREQRAKAQTDLQALREVQTPKTDTKPVEELLKRVNALVVAYGLAADEAGRQQVIIPRLLAGYDAVNRTLKAQADQESATSNELRQQLATLKEMAPVRVALARRQFGPADNLPEVKVPVLAEITDVQVPRARRLVIELLGTVTDIQIPESVKDRAAKTLTFKDLPPVAVEVDPTFDIRNFSEGFRNALSDLRLAKADLGVAELTNDQKDLAAATDKTSEATKRLRVIAKQLADAIRSSPDLTPAQKEAGLEQIAQFAADAARNTKTLGDRLRGIGTFTRGVLSAADAIGLIGDKARLAVTNVADLVDSVGQLTNAIAEGSKGDIIGAFIQTATSATNIVKSIFGDVEANDKQNREIIRNNTQALVRLSQDLNGFSDSVRQQLTAAEAIRTNPLVRARLADGTTRGFKSVEELDRQLRASGTSLAELKRRAEEFGITITDASGRVTAQGLHDLDVALRLAAAQAVKFGNTFEQQSDAAALRRRVLGFGEDQEKIFEDSVALFRQFAPKLFDTFFAGIDITTKEGREQFRKALVAFVKAFTENTIGVADFGDLDRETIIRIVNEWVDSLDEATDAVKKFAGEMVNVATGFAVSNRVFKAITQGLNDRNTIDIKNLIPLPPRPVPVPIPVGGDDGAASVTIDLGGVTVSPSVPATGAARYNEIRQQALDRARAISPAAVAAVQQAFPPL